MTVSPPRPRTTTTFFLRGLRGFVGLSIGDRGAVPGLVGVVVVSVSAGCTRARDAFQRSAKRSITRFSRSSRSSLCSRESYSALIASRISFGTLPPKSADQSDGLTERDEIPEPIQ